VFKIQIAISIHCRKVATNHAVQNHVIIFQSVSEEEYSPFDHHWRPAKIPNCDLSEDESSGVSSTDNSLDNVLKGESITVNSHSNVV
jgi:hypothetical protein